MVSSSSKGSHPMHTLQRDTLCPTAAAPHSLGRRRLWAWRRRAWAGRLGRAWGRRRWGRGACCTEVPVRGSQGRANGGVRRRTQQQFHARANQRRRWQQPHPIAVPLTLPVAAVRQITPAHQQCTGDWNNWRRSRAQSGSVQPLHCPSLSATASALLKRRRRRGWALQLSRGRS